MPDMDWAELAQLAENEKFEMLPEGQTFAFMCEKAEVKNTASGNGINVSMLVKVAEGPEAGRKTFCNIFIPSPNADVKPGAYGMMAAKLNAIGVPLTLLAQHNATPAQAATLFIGKVFLGTIEHREWPKGSGSFRDGVGTIAPIPGAGQMPGVPGSSNGSSTSTPSVPGASTSAPPDSTSSASEAPKAPW